MKFNVTLLFLSIFLSTLAFGQSSQPCGTELLDEYYRSVNPDYAHYRDNQITYLNSLQNNSTSKAAGKILIPVVVHVIYYEDWQNISDAQVHSQITIMNKDFNKLNWDTIKVPSVFKPLIADCEIEFVLANRDPDGNRTNGITRTKTTIKDIAAIGGTLYYQTSKGGHDIWDRDEYLNIWVCEIAGGIYGFATKPGAPAASDGLVIDFISFGNQGTAQSPTHLGRTVSHEVGHWFDLVHIWGDSQCGDDFVSDTPVQEGPTDNCPFFPEVSCSNGPNGDMFVNYMDYSSDNCMNMFTEGQKTRMWNAINSSRNSLFNSKGYNSISENNNITFSVFPNPVNDVLFIENDENTLIESLEVSNLSGSIVYRGGNFSGNYQVNLTEVPDGLYILKIQHSKAIFTDKIVVWHHR